MIDWNRMHGAPPPKPEPTKLDGATLCWMIGGPFGGHYMWVMDNVDVTAIPVAKESLWYPYKRLDEDSFVWDGRKLTELEVVLEHRGESLEDNLSNWSANP